MERRTQDSSTNLHWAAEALGVHRQEILQAFEDRLRTAGSTLVGQSGTSQELWTQSEAILDDVSAILRDGSAETRTGEDKFSEVVGASRASDRVHPSESLRAVGELSDAILFGILREFPRGVPHTQVAEIASTIQRATMERVARASISYVDHLLWQVIESHGNERRRLSRELHDRVANSLAVAYQNAELHEGLKTKDPARAARKLELSRGALQDALGSARELSAELRHSIVDEGLEVALSDLVPSITPRCIDAALSFEGDESQIPAYVKDELFLILREGLRNSVVHAGAARIRIKLSITPEQIGAAVVDDGIGFDPGAADFRPGTGIKSMRERAELLGGSHEIRSNFGAGTTMQVYVPVARRG